MAVRSGRLAEGVNVVQFRSDHDQIPGNSEMGKERAPADAGPDKLL